MNERAVVIQSPHAKKPAPEGAGQIAAIPIAAAYERVRERIMKVSKVYSATCHQRNPSPRKATRLS